MNLSVGPAVTGAWNPSRQLATRTANGDIPPRECDGRGGDLLRGANGCHGYDCHSPAFRLPPPPRPAPKLVQAKTYFDPFVALFKLGLETVQEAK